MIWLLLIIGVFCAAIAEFWKPPVGGGVRRALLIVGGVVVGGYLAFAAGLIFYMFSATTTENYRYKLTLTLNTPDGPKTASNIVAMRIVAGRLGVGHDMRGEALYVDMGVGKRPLVALLTAQNPPLISRKDGGWAEIGPYFLGLVFPSKTLEDAPLHEPHAMLPGQLPDLLTFANTDDPTSAIAVDPEDLEATLGAGISWGSLTVELTDEPVTSGLSKMLPWLPDKLPKGKPGYRWAARVSGTTRLPQIEQFPFREVCVRDFIRNDF